MGAGTDYDVIVVGGGPAGSSAAYELARSGVSVALLEKHFMPRYKACGGGIVARAMKLLPFDVSGVIERSCTRAELHLLDADLHFSVARATPIVHMTMRDRFDEFLLSRAREAGAECKEGVTVRKVIPGGLLTEVVADKRSFRARFVIGADGAVSIVAGQTGRRERSDVMPLLEWEIRGAEDGGRTLPTAPRFDIGIVPLGYAWIFPKKGHLSVGLGSMSVRGPELRRMLQSYIGSRGIAGNGIKLRQSAHLLPRRPRKGAPARDGILLVGDAAGLVDPVTWEGISYAILSGQLAARSIVTGGLDREAAGQAYATELRSQVLQDLRWGRLLAAFLYRHPLMRTRFFRKYGQRFTETMADVFMGRKRYSDVFSRWSIYGKQGGD